MHVLGKTVEKRDNVGWELGGSFVEFGCQGVHLLFGGDFRGEEKPDKRFKEWLSISGLSREGGEHLRKRNAFDWDVTKTAISK